MGKVYKILAVNPGSTSTKIGIFENTQEIYSKNISHSADDLKLFKEVQDQLEYRKKVVEEEILAQGLTLADFDVFVGRGGGLVPIKGGVYAVGPKLLEHASIGTSGQHPAQLASQICGAFAAKQGKPAFVVNPPDVDEFEEISRITGMKGLYRESRIHALNQKEIALRYCAEHNQKYQESNLIICHIGGGVSVTAHKEGRMIDSNDIINGDGPMTPTRTGGLPAVPLLKMCFSGKFSEKELYNIISKNGGLVDHLGTADAIEVQKMIENGDKYAELVFNAMIYQIAKYVGSCAVSLKGKAEAIILTGGISHSKYLVEKLQEYLDWIAPLTVMAGEFEMEALAAGALRAVTGQEGILEYSGEPVWEGF